MILATAAFEVRLYVPLAVPGLRVLQKVVRAGKVKSYVRGDNADPGSGWKPRAMRTDPLIFRQIAVNVSARSPRHRAATARGCRCDSGADADAGGGTRLGRQSESAAGVF